MTFKKIAFILTALIVFAGTSFGQENEVVHEPKFFPRSPQIMAQGGSFTANAKGFNALFTNPAGFSTGRMSLTIVSTNPWLYAFPDPETIAVAQAVLDDPASGIEQLNDLLTGSGTGVGLQTGLGFVGSGFGIGFMLLNDIYAYGPNTLGVKVDANITAALIAGVSFPLTLGGFTITPGASVRPMYRLRAYDVGISNFMGLIDGGDPSTISAEVLAGLGLGIDLGVNLAYGPLTAAVAIRDLGGTKFDFGALTVEETMTAFQMGTLPEGTPVEGVEYVIPMSAHLGLSFHPDVGGLSFLFDPTVHLEYVARLSGDEDVSPWMNLHLGTEVRVLRLLRLRAGLNQGYTTLGLGVKLLFLEAHVSYFGRELGTYPGAHQSQAVTAEIALRF